MKELYGILGERLSHSFSPQIHSLIFKEININGYYHVFEVNKNDLKDAVLGFKALKVKGVNVTIPYKVKAMQYLDEISKEAEDIGAVNTICFRDGKTIGYNTDYYGFGRMLNKANIEVKNKSAVILGTGGAAKAVVQYLKDQDISQITFISRNPKQVSDSFKKYNTISYDDVKNMDSKDIVINTTPCGMYPNIETSPFNKNDLAKFKAAVDLIYNPQETLFLKYAKEYGAKAIDGLYMLVGQAIKAEELWNGVQIKDELVDTIYDIFIESLK